MAKGLRRNRQGEKTKAELLEAAGYVFSKKGYEGASVRDIAKIANVLPGALTYHFKTKKNLFKMVLKHFILDCCKFDKMFEAFDSVDPHNPQEISQAIYKSVKGIIYICHKRGVKIKNLNGLLVTLMLDGGKEFCHIVQEMGTVRLRKVYECIRVTNVTTDRTDIFWWSNLLWALVFYPIYGKYIMLSAMDESRYSDDFIESMAARISMNLCRYLNLPRPEVNDPWRLKADPEERIEGLSPMNFQQPPEQAFRQAVEESSHSDIAAEE